MLKEHVIIFDCYWSRSKPVPGSVGRTWGTPLQAHHRADKQKQPYALTPVPWYAHRKSLAGKQAQNLCAGMQQHELWSPMKIKEG